MLVRTNIMIIPKVPFDYQHIDEDLTETTYFVSSVGQVHKDYVHILKQDPPATAVGHGFFDSIQSEPFNYTYIRMPTNLFFHKIRTENTNFINEMDNSVDDLLKVFPIATRYINSSNHIVVERPPFKATIRFTPNRAQRVFDTKTNVVKEVWVPWQVYIVNFNLYRNAYKMKMFFRDAPLSSEDSRLYDPWTTNLYSDNVICFGSDGVMVESQINSMPSDQKTVKNVFDILCMSYWMGGWNGDILPSQFSMPTWLKVPHEVDPKITESYFKNETDFNIYNQAISKTVFTKHRHKDYRQYIQLLDIWSNYSLSDLLHLMSKYKNNYNANCKTNVVTLKTQLAEAKEDDMYYCESSHPHYSNSGLFLLERDLAIFFKHHEANWRPYEISAQVKSHNSMNRNNTDYYLEQTFETIPGIKERSYKFLIQEELHERLNRVIEYADKKYPIKSKNQMNYQTADFAFGGFQDVIFDEDNPNDLY